MHSLSRILLAVVVTGAISACSKQPPEAEVTSDVPAAAAAPQAFKVVGSSRDIMLAVTIPASDAVFTAAAEPPTTDEQWVRVERAALALAESGNLLLMSGRAVDDSDWSRFAGMLIDTAAQAHVAARAKDIDGVSDAGDRIYEACEGCHKKYMPQPPANAQ